MTLTVNDLDNGARDLETVGAVANSRDPNSNAVIDEYPTRLGDQTDTLNGRLKKLGYLPPITYAAGISFSVGDNVKTVEEGGVVYAPLPSEIPFTTSGTWVGGDEGKFFVVQGVIDSDLGLYVSAEFDTVADLLSGSSQNIGAVDFSTYLGRCVKTQSPIIRQWRITNDVTSYDLGGGIYAREIEVTSSTATLDVLSDLKLSDYQIKKTILIKESVISFRRNLAFDDPGKAGADAELIDGTLVAYDANGAAFSENKDAVSKRVRSEGKVPGKNVHIYQWGSPYGGNDWSFVRTPENYDPSGEPHPFLILNHGNGWVMDGTLPLANFSTRTQFGVDSQNGGTYLDTSRPDYVEYSSPMIEAFLSEGYIVCGAQNNGTPSVNDAGYGNRETVQNIWFFYEHIKNNYNAKDHCHMISASNGSIATVNAARQMGRSRVRSISMLYPLINLHAAWRSGRPGWEGDIANAYNFSGNPSSFTDFIGGTRGSDPFVASCELSPRIYDTRYSDPEAAYSNSNFYRLYDDSGETKWLRENRLIDPSAATDLSIDLESITFWRKTSFDYPRMRCHYSPDDTVTPMDEHSLPWLEMLERGNIVHFGEQVTGSHGDYTHFEGLDGNGVSRLIGWTKL